MNYSNNEISVFERLEEHLIVLEKRLNIHRNKILKIYGTAIFLIFIGFLDQLFSLLITIYFPIILTLRSLHNKEKEDKKRWLTYWSVFGILYFIDLFSVYIKVVLPFYFFLKTLILIVLSIPTLNTANYFYESIMKKFIARIGLIIKNEKELLTTEIINVLKSKAPELVPPKKEKVINDKKRLNIWDKLKKTYSKIADKKKIE
jgi:hypothetical protein